MQSITTGVKPSVHKVMDSRIFDPHIGEIDYSESLYKQQNKYLPIYTLNELNGGKSGCINWPGCEFTFENVTVENSNISNLSLDEQVEYICEKWLESDEMDYNLILHRVGEIADVARKYGTESKQYMKTANEVIQMLEKYNNCIMRSVSYSKINFMFMSDNAIVDIYAEQIIDVEKFLQNVAHESITKSPLKQVRFHEGVGEGEINKTINAIHNYYGMLHIDKTTDGMYNLIAKPHAAFSDLRIRINRHTLKSETAGYG